MLRNREVNAPNRSPFTVTLSSAEDRSDASSCRLLILSLVAIAFCSRRPRRQLELSRAEVRRPRASRRQEQRRLKASTVRSRHEQDPAPPEPQEHQDPAPPARRQEPRRWTGIHADPFHSYCVALVVAAHNELENWALQQGMKYSDFSDLCQKQEAVREVLGSFAKVCVLYSHR
jgi:hypothetical protein